MVTRPRINRVAMVTLTVLTLATVFLVLVYVSGDRAETPDSAFAIDSKPYEQILVEIVASDYRLYFRYPGYDHVIETNDDRFGMKHLYVPSGSLVRLRLNSCDFVYTAEIPRVDVYEIAAPDLVFEVDFSAPQPGTYDLLSSQMCGYDHPDLLGKMIVQSDRDFRSTMQSLSAIPLTPVP